MKSCDSGGHIGQITLEVVDDVIREECVLLAGGAGIESAVRTLDALVVL